MEEKEAAAVVQVRKEKEGRERKVGRKVAVRGRRRA